MTPPTHHPKINTNSRPPWPARETAGFREFLRLADELSDYLYARSTGHIGSLITLINRGCQRAVRTGAERLTQDLLDRVKNDESSEKARQELQSALQAGKLTTRISERAS